MCTASASQEGKSFIVFVWRWAACCVFRGCQWWWVPIGILLSISNLFPICAKSIAWNNALCLLLIRTRKVDQPSKLYHTFSSSFSKPSARFSARVSYPDSLALWVKRIVRNLYCEYVVWVLRLLTWVTPKEALSNSLWMGHLSSCSEERLNRKTLSVIPSESWVTRPFFPVGFHTLLLSTAYDNTAIVILGILFYSPKPPFLRSTTMDVV